MSSVSLERAKQLTCLLNTRRLHRKRLSSSGLLRHEMARAAFTRRINSFPIQSTSRRKHDGSNSRKIALERGNI